MVLTLYGYPDSPCTKRVAVVLKEKDIAFTFVPIDLLKGEHKSTEFMKKQPFGQVPYIDDNGFQLYESRAIGRYLAAKYPAQGPTLLPTELKARALFEQAASVEVANFDPATHGLAAEKIYKKAFGLDTDEAKVAEYTATLGGKLDAYEVILSQQTYVAGNEITLADLFHLPNASTVKGINPELISARPHVAQWLERLQARPAWVAVQDGL
ncbi:glutathione S-transferase [Athelia psychrophila]|uniref:glutathione transferase n=1 Tax=Athelia psychrophila TaxID=1759441 RepID=A0A166JBL6_9AGAM|nr:glutathione S-transferase [Fibularhizoctonia sp. CBS 109695]KZP20697.1 glutathione S-transferase [Fibularhizoctonia sp. CBS 109695]